MSDTSKPGGFLKDYIYLKGDLLVTDYLKTGGDIEDLMLGKVGLRDVAILKKLKKQLSSE